MGHIILTYTSVRVRNSPDIYSKTEAEAILKKLFEVFHEPPSARYSWQYAILTPFIVVAVCSGLRRSEVLGLTWADTDGDFFTLDVNKQSKLVKGERAKITPKLKTDKSCRVINADPLAFEVLREYRVKQQAQAESCGAAWGDASYNGSGLIFTAWNGEILPPNQPYDRFKEFCKKFGLPFRNIHSLRHYRTSYRIAKGDNIYDVSADLGHCQLTTTLNISNGHTRGKHGNKAVYPDKHCIFPARKKTVSQ
jgi:integrase